MSNVKQLLNLLDADSLGLLEKASRFCVEQRHSQVSLEHYLLQMLDDAHNPLNKLLQKEGIDPLDWIRTLLIRCAGFKQDQSVNPVFSQSLLEWFRKASRQPGAVSAEARLQPQDLIISLLQNFKLVRSLGLNDLDKLQMENVTAFFAGRADVESSKINAETADNLQDCTLMMTDDEIAHSATSVNNELEIDLLKISGYADLEKIGEGGMARVYRANHTGLDRAVALKILKSENTTDNDFVARFLREARIVAKLAHPNIIQIYDVNQHENITYLAMEFVSGGELSDRMEAGFSLTEVVEILSQVLAALQSAHDRGYVHRDIKPANILFRDDASVVLTDFGIARIIGEDSGLTMAGSVLGTPRYMSPEQARGDELDHRSDLYSVGVLFYQMLEKKLPYVGESAMGTAMKHILDPIPALSAELQTHQSFVNRAMAKSVSERFQSGREMMMALQLLKV